MKRIIVLILCISALCFNLVSCREGRNARRMLEDFVAAYGADGIIYSPEVGEGNDGYVYDGLMERIYVFSGSFPTNYAVFLNSRPDFYAECAIFVCSDAAMLNTVEEMCLERVRLLSGGANHAFVRRSGNICFYSTMPDRERAEKIFSEIIR